MAWQKLRECLISTAWAVPMAIAFADCIGTVIKVLLLLLILCMGHSMLAYVSCIPQLIGPGKHTSPDLAIRCKHRLKAHQCNLPSMLKQITVAGYWSKS
jgi:hypothetical protein